MKLKNEAKSNRTRSEVCFYLNGSMQHVGADYAGLMLADYLRKVKNLTGTKIVCAEGDCGACTVLMYRPRPKESASQKRFLPVNSCILNMAQVDGCYLVTVDGLADGLRDGLSDGLPDPILTPVQEALMNTHASQCGFCTPGIVMSLTGLIEKKLCSGMKSDHCSDYSSDYCGEQEAKNALTGNLCRCTGYQAIIDASKAIPLAKCQSLFKRHVSPKKTTVLLKATSKSLHLRSDGLDIYAPLKLSDALQYLSKNSTARLMASNTDLGVMQNKGKLSVGRVVSLHLIPELQECKVSGKFIHIGARVPLREVRDQTKRCIPAFSSFLDLFASPQIKNIATLVGNIGTASPIADTPPFLLTVEAVLHTVKWSKGRVVKRIIPLTEYYLVYRKTALQHGEIITRVTVMIPPKHAVLKIYKTSQRKDLDISTVNLAIYLETSKNKKSSQETIGQIRIALGGVAATPIRLKLTEKLLKGKVLTALSFAEDLQKAVTSLQSEISPISDLRASAQFRRLVAENLFLKFFRENVRTTT